MPTRCTDTSRVQYHCSHRRLLFKLAILFIVCLYGLVEETGAVDVKHLQMVKQFELPGVEEPSGIVFHAQRGTLFVVGDEGDIAELRPDGTLVKQQHLRDADFEGITCHPGNGLLYVVIEHEECILEINPEDFSVLREFSIARQFQGHILLPPEGEGVEAITFVPDDDSSESGSFYLTNQNVDPESRYDPSIIVEVKIPLFQNTPEGHTATIIRYFSIQAGDLSGLHYDTASKHLYVISDMTDTLFIISTSGEIIDALPLPGKDQEGITRDHSGSLYIVQDSGGMIQYREIPTRQP